LSQRPQDVQLVGRWRRWNRASYGIHLAGGGV
jgi:hypothetical protein